jgi:hypothetical protein
MKPLNFREPIAWLIILALGFFLWGQCQKSKVLKLQAEADKKQLQEVIEAKTVEILTRDRAIFNKDSLRLLDSLQFRTREIASNAEIRLYRQTINRLRPQIAPQLAENDTLSAFVTATDSLIDNQARLIRDQEIFCTGQVRDLQEIIQLNEQKFQSQVEISEAWRSAAVQSEKDVRKANRKKGFWRTSAAILAGGVLFLTIQK